MSINCPPNPESTCDMLCGNDLAKMETDGLVTVNEGQVKLTERGILFADSVASILLS